MATLGKLTWIELKLFMREPLTMVFTFALPLIFLFVMGGVFGNTPDPEGEVFRGVGPMDYYVPAYIALVLASLGVVGLPVHLAAYREQGVLRRLRASSVSIWSVFGAQLGVTLVIALLGSVLLVLVGMLRYDAGRPESLALVIPAFLIGVLAFVAVGVLLGALLPNTRAAQGIGLILFFVMLILGGAGPPREVMPSEMRFIGDLTPLKYVIVVLQDPWLGFGWGTTASLVTVGIAAAAAGLAAWTFRWE